MVRKLGEAAVACVGEAAVACGGETAVTRRGEGVALYDAEGRLDDVGATGGDGGLDGSADRSNNVYFRMGAAVAVGELYDAGRLGEKAEVAGEVRSFLKSFGIDGIEDVRALGVTGPYIEDFRALYC